MRARSARRLPRLSHHDQPPSTRSCAARNRKHVGENPRTGTSRAKPTSIARVRRRFDVAPASRIRDGCRRLRLQRRSTQQAPQTGEQHRGAQRDQVAIGADGIEVGAFAGLLRDAPAVGDGHDAEQQEQGAVQAVQDHDGAFRPGHSCARLGGEVRRVVAGSRPSVRRPLAVSTPSCIVRDARQSCVARPLCGDA